MKTFFKLVILCVTLWLASPASAHLDATEPRVIAYFSGRIGQLDSIDARKLTHLIFCFGHLDGNRFKVDNAKDSAIIRKMVTLKKDNPGLKVLLSLGGWGGCETCSFAFSTPAGRQEFATAFKNLNDYFHTDGIDLDWEYPAIRLDNDIDANPVHQAGPEDQPNFTDLVKRLRTALGNSSEISFAAGGFETYLKGSIDWPNVMPLVNYVNLMSYDIINGYSTETGHHTALYSTPKQKESTDNAVTYLLNIGVDAKKIIIGAAFYARVWEAVPATDNGLYQPGKFKTAINFSDFENQLSPAAGYQAYWDDTAKAPYSYNKEKKLFATYDDRKSIAAKTNYVIQKGLGGIMFWELSHDLPRGGLVDIIISTIHSEDRQQ